MLGSSTQVQQQFVGVVIDRKYTILDMVETEAGDVFILCLNSENPVHKYVTWGVNKDDLADRWAGRYCFTLQEALDDFNLRTGRRAMAKIKASFIIENNGD